ncbi:hypothetical protein COLO4_01679, partial [Corchorus olitorius]
GDVVRILLHDRLDAPGGEEIVLAFTQVQRDGGAALGAFDRVDGEFAVARAFPAHAFFGRHAGAARFHRYAVGHDERRVEAHAKLTDEGGVLLLVARQLAEELARARTGDGAEVADGLVAAHADAVVGDGDGARGSVKADADAQLPAAFQQRRIGDALEAQLVDRIRRIGNQLPQEDFLVAVQRVDHQMQKLLHFCLESHLL